MNTYIAFYNQKEIQIQADSQWKASLQARIDLKVPKSKIGLLSVVLVAKEAKLKQFKEELLSTIRNFGVDIGELIDLLKDTEFDLVQTELAENHFHYAIQAALNTIEQPEPKEICFKDAEEFTTAHTVKAFPATSREYSKLLGLENTYWGDREGYIVEDNHPLSPEEVMWISKDEFERYFKLKER